MESLKKQKEFIFPKKITTIYNFDYHIDTVFKILKDFDIVSQYFNEMRSGVTIINGKNTYEMGNIFSFVWYNQTILQFKVVEIIEEQNYKKINWRVSSEQWKISYNYSYELHYNTIQENSLMIFEINYDNPKILPFSKTTLRDYHRILLETCTLLNKYFNDNVINKEQTESIVINCERKKLWQILINLNKLYQFNKDNSTVFEYEGEYLQENMKIKMKSNRNKSTNNNDEIIDEIFIVKNIFHSHAEEKWTYDLENYNEEKEEKFQSNIPNQKINFCLIEISENKNFLIIKHYFKSNIKKKGIKKLSKDKKKILLNLKKYLEADQLIL